MVVQVIAQGTRIVLRIFLVTEILSIFTDHFCTMSVVVARVVSIVRVLLPVESTLSSTRGWIVRVFVPSVNDPDGRACQLVVFVADINVPNPRASFIVISPVFLSRVALTGRAVVSTDIINFGFAVVSILTPVTFFGIQDAFS